MTCHRAVILGVILGLLLFHVNGAPVRHRTGFFQAIHPRAFHFPRIMEIIPGFRQNGGTTQAIWSVQAGRSFGYQLTFFQGSAQAIRLLRTGSSWRTNQLYFAHLALSDLKKSEFLTDEKAGRGAMGIGGVSSERDAVRVFLHGWESVIQGKIHQLQAGSDRFGIALGLVCEKPPVLHGNRGLSRKGRAQGQASYYYTLTE